LNVTTGFRQQCEANNQKPFEQEEHTNSCRQRADNWTSGHCCIGQHSLVHTKRPGKAQGNYGTKDCEAERSHLQDISVDRTKSIQINKKIRIIIVMLLLIIWNCAAFFNIFH
jgi:hypothetical protein